MYVEIKDNKLLSWCENPYLDYTYVEIDYSTFDPEKYEIQNGELIDISDTETYRIKIAKAEASLLKERLQAQLKEVDVKRVRAICEPQIKDSESGQTWLEYYTQQAIDLRTQIAAL